MVIQLVLLYAMVLVLQNLFREFCHHFTKDIFRLHIWIIRVYYVFSRAAQIKLGDDVPDPGLVDNGSPCLQGRSKVKGICLDRKCIKLADVKLKSCPLGINGSECSGNGVSFFKCFRRETKNFNEWEKGDMCLPILDLFNLYSNEIKLAMLFSYTYTLNYYKIFPAYFIQKLKHIDVSFNMEWQNG